MSYIPLNVKTSYHLLSSLNDIKKLIRKCQDYNIHTIAVTDPNMFSVMDFYKECKGNNIKPIIGLELEIDNNIIYLYAINYSGYQNLTKILYLKQESGLNIGILKEHSTNLICLVPFLSISLYDQLKNIYQYLYLSYNDLKQREKLQTISNKLVFANEVLYLNKDDKSYLRYLYLIRDGKKECDAVQYHIDEKSYLMDKEEVSVYMEKEDLNNMIEINNLCNIDFSYNEKLLPTYNEEINFDEILYLKSLCKKGLEKRLLSSIPSNYVERLKYELDIINKMGFSNYFLVVWDFVKYAKKNNILVGPGRGSAAGSLVSYCLGITDVDPIKYNLLFERFLNPERISMPDIDIDFESNRRAEVVSYVINKYGKKRAMPIITFVTLGGRQVIRDLGRIFDIETMVLDKLCKLIIPKDSLKENFDNNKELRFMLKKEKRLYNLYMIGYKLEGMKRQISIHAAGIVISNLQLDSYIPIQKYDNYYITGLSMEHLEELGLLKIDFLGLKNLTLIESILNIINKEKEILTFNNIPLDDKKVFSLFSTGLTEGIFQFESVGMKNFLKKLKPNNFEDLVAAIALFRPGPMANIDSYIKRKQGLEKIHYQHIDLYEILKPTYGIIVYQEQIMQIANVMAGYSLGEADVLRRAMSKKKKDILENEQQKFISRSIAKGYEKGVALKVYNLILKFADYGFNRAHSVAYSLIGYKMAYLKVHYKEHFMSSLLTNVIGSESKTKEYINECLVNNIMVLKPDINMSEYQYKVDSLGIRLSLAAIKNVGTITCKEILKIRQHGQFIDFFDFVGRTYGRSVNRKTIESLIDASCFAVFGYNHQTLHHNIEKAINYAELIKLIDVELVEKPVIEVVKEYERDELGKREIKVLGFYLGCHPVSKYKGRYDNVVAVSSLSSLFDKVVNIVICVDKVTKIKTKKEEEMLFVVGSDEIGVIDLVFFPKLYKKYKNINHGDVLYVTGRVEKRMSRYQLIVISVEKL